MPRSLLTHPRAYLLTALCALSATGPLPAQAPTPQTDRTHPVIRVVDGDTVVLSLDGVEASPSIFSMTWSSTNSSRSEPMSTGSAAQVAAGGAPRRELEARQHVHTIGATVRVKGFQLPGSRLDGH